MAKQDDKFTFEATVVEALPNAMFKVRLPNEQETEILAYVYRLDDEADRSRTREQSRQGSNSPRRQETVGAA